MKELPDHRVMQYKQPAPIPMPTSHVTPSPSQPSTPTHLNLSPSASPKVLVPHTPESDPGQVLPLSAETHPAAPNSLVGMHTIPPLVQPLPNPSIVSPEPESDPLPDETPTGASNCSAIPDGNCAAPTSTQKSQRHKGQDTNGIPEGLATDGTTTENTTPSKAKGSKGVGSKSKHKVVPEPHQPPNKKRR